MMTDDREPMFADTCLDPNLGGSGIARAL